MKKIISIFGLIFILTVGMGMTAFSRATSGEVDVTISVTCTEERNFDRCTTIRGVTSLNFIQDIINEHDQIRIPFRRKEDMKKGILRLESSSS